MDDLIKRLKAPGWIYRYASGKQWVDDAPMMAAAALTEAQATIARQQVMLDRALEDVGAKMVEIGHLREALERARLWVGYAMLDGDRDAEADAKSIDAALNTPETAPPE